MVKHHQEPEEEASDVPGSKHRVAEEPATAGVIEEPVAPVASRVLPTDDAADGWSYDSAKHWVERLGDRWGSQDYGYGGIHHGVASLALSWAGQRRKKSPSLCAWCACVPTSRGPAQKSRIPVAGEEMIRGGCVAEMPKSSCGRKWAREGQFSEKKRSAAVDARKSWYNMRRRGGSEKETIRWNTTQDEQGH